jgi:hypothetical protein
MVWSRKPANGVATEKLQTEARITPDDIEQALADAVIPDIVELHDAFERAKPLVRSLAAGHRSEAADRQRP